MSGVRHAAFTQQTRQCGLWNCGLDSAIKPVTVADLPRYSLAQFFKPDHDTDLCGAEMNDNNQDLDAALEGVDESKRSTLRRLIGTGAFVVPVVATVTMSALSVDGMLHAAAAASNATMQPTPI